MRRVRTIAGDTVNVLLYRELGRSDDEAEAAFWKLNQNLAEGGVFLSSDQHVVLPELEAKPSTAAQISAWD
jgi:phage tail protein X